MARRRTVKAVVREIREKHPEMKVDVLYDPSGGWSGHMRSELLPESEWGEYRVDDVRYFDTLAVVEAS